MASDSEPRKFFSEAPLEAPSEVTFLGAKKPVMTQLELTNSNSGGCRTTQSAIASSFPTDSIHCLTAERVLYASRLARHLSRFSSAVV